MDLSEASSLSDQSQADADQVVEAQAIDGDGEASIAELITTHWNQRQWPQTAKYLGELYASEHPMVGSDPVERRLILLLVGICASFNGQYKLAKRFFMVLLEHLQAEADSYVLDGLDISAAHWLGDTCLLLREIDNAALAWSVALEGTAEHEQRLPAQRRRLLASLHYVQDGSLLGDALTKRTLAQLAGALSHSAKTRINTFGFMSNQEQATYIASAVPYCSDKAKPNVDIATWEARTGDLTMDASVWKYPSEPSNSWKFQYDRFLLLDPRKFQYIKDWALDINYAQLDLRFWPNLHQEYKFISKVPVTSIYSTRKRSLKWIVSSLESALNARGMLCTHHFERLKVVRIREFGLMDYVAAFVIVFIRTPFYTVFGAQVPAHDVRKSWGKAHAPSFSTKNRLVRELQEILATAELRDDSDDPKYKDVWMGTDVSWDHGLTY